MGGFERTRDKPAAGYRPQLAATLPPLDIGSPKLDGRQARSQGYTGNSCSHCGSMRMQIAGHCEVCSDCGTTTGCS